MWPAGSLRLARAVTIAVIAARLRRSFSKFTAALAKWSASPAAGCCVPAAAPGRPIPAANRARSATITDALDWPDRRWNPAAGRYEITRTGQIQLAYAAAQRRADLALPPAWRRLEGFTA